MKKTVATNLWKIFTDNFYFSQKYNKVLQTILDSKGWENGTEIDIFVKVKSSLEMPILLIKVERNETKEIDTYQIFRLESNRWEISTIDDIINLKTFLLMYKFKQNYDIFEIFTEEDISVSKIIRFIEKKDLFFNEIALDLLIRYPKSPKLRLMCSLFNLKNKNSYVKSLFQVLHKNNRNGEIEFLLQNECQFPKLEIIRSIPLIEKKFKSNKEFHKLIKDGKFEAIDKFLEANPNQQYIYNEDNHSACYVAAMEMQNFELFSFLCKSGLTFTVYEINGWNNKRDDKKGFFLTNTFSGLDMNKILQILESKTLTINKKATDLSVNDIYKELRKIPSMNLIFNLLNKYRPILIYIDYQESSSRFSPYRLDFYSNDCKWYGFDKIFISGGGETKQLLGSFAIEFTSFVMYLIYKNKGKPYDSDDDKNQKRFNEIVQDIRKKVSNKAINKEFIKSVFKLSENYWHSELISCVNYVFAFYGQDRGKKILQLHTPELLEFYETCVKPDLEKYLRGHFNSNYNLFNTHWHREMESYEKCVPELNNLSKFTAADYLKNVIIQSDCVELTCLKLFQNITMHNNSPLNIDNTYFIDFNTFSNNNYEIVSHLPQWELLILYTFDGPFISNVCGNFIQYVNKVGKRFIFIFDLKRKLSYQDICQDNVVTFTDSFEPTNIDQNSQKLVFNIFQVNFQGKARKLRELINFEEYLTISYKLKPIRCVDGPLYSLGHRLTPDNYDPFYVYRKFKTTIFELDELRDEIVEKFVCENITDELKESKFALKTKNNKLVTFPGKTLRIKEDYKPVNEPMEISSQNSKKEHDDMDNDIFILSLKSSETFIIIDEAKEIEINHFSYADMKTFSENNNNFNIHWFVESDSREHFYHHLKTFGSFDHTRSFCYRQKCTIDEKDLLIKLQHQKVLLIAAPTGMGKSYTISNMAFDLFANNSSLWIPIVFLNEKCQILKNFCFVNSKPDYLLEFLTELLQFKSDFKEEMFKLWYRKKANQIYLFLIGDDIDDPELTDIIIELIKRLSQTDIKHIIFTTRQIGKFKFELELDTIAIEMERFSYDETIKYLVNWWVFGTGWNTYFRYVRSNDIQIARRVEKHFRNFDDFLNSPFQIYLVAELCRNELENFSSNIMNLYHYFNNELSPIKIYKKLIEITLTSNISRKDLTINISINHLNLDKLQYSAVRVLLNDDEVKLFLTPEEIEIQKNCIGDKNIWLTFRRIIDETFSEKLDFSHRTYAHYYFANFLLDYYKSWNKNTEQFFFEHILVKKQFDFVRMFLNSYEGTSDLLSRKPTFFQVPATLHDAVVQNIEENNINILQYLYNLGFNLTINPSSLITKHINNHSLNSIEKLIETIKYLVTNCSNVHLSINELRQFKKILPRIPLQDCIELKKALLQCELFDLDDVLLQGQTEAFLSLWDDAKTKAKILKDQGNNDSKLLQIFDDMYDEMYKRFKDLKLVS